MKKTIIVLLAGLFALSAYADRPYGAAGCGLGSAVMGKSGNQVFASTTNGTFGSQTFGISSGTSNCTDNGMVTSQMELPTFVEVNQLALANDIARGSGETIANLSLMLGCVDATHLASTLQKNYNRIFPTGKTRAASLTDSIVGVVKSDSALSASCTSTI